MCLQVSHPALAEDDGKSSVTVEVRTKVDETLPDSKIELFQPDKKTRVDVKFRNSVATGVPYGSYILRVFSPAFSIHEQTLRVNQPEITVRVYLTIGDIGHRGPTPKTVQDPRH